MPLVYPGSAAIPQYQNALASFMPAFEAGQKDRKDSDAFDAAAKAFGGKGAPAKEQSFLERLAAPFTRPQPAPTATAAINAAVPQTPRPFNGMDVSIPTSAATSIAPEYILNARRAESGGNDNAANPRSSALGRYQFLESTWNGLANQYPELGLTADGRTDPAQQERAMARFTQDNATALAQAGVPVDPGSLYAAHFLGAGGATKALTADPSTPMTNLVDPGVISANPQLQGMTAGDFAQWAQGKGGNQSGGYQPPMRDEGAGQGQPFTPDEGTMRTLLASDATRPLAMSLIQAQQETQASQGRFVTEQGQDGGIWQRDTLTGERKVLQEAPPPAVAPARPMTPEERHTWGIPETDTRPYTFGKDGVPEPIGGSSGQTINVNTGETGDFYKAIDTENGKAIAGLIDAGTVAQGNGLRITQLEKELAAAPQGAGGSLTQLAGRLGIPVDGVDELQAAQALINQLVPGQRQPGSGTMSDADLALFKESLPAIANQPGGNAKILATMKAINAYTVAQAQIANQIANREVTPAEGRAALMALPNPLANIASPPASAGTGEPARPTSDDEYNAIPSGGLFIDPDDGQTYRKP